MRVRYWIAIVASLLFVLWFFENSSHVRQWNIEKEINGFERLGHELRESLRNAHSLGRDHLTFDEFHRLIRQKHPEWVADANANNPFSGIIPPAVDVVVNSDVKRANDVLMYSKSIHYRPGGNHWQMRIFGDGTVSRESFGDDQAAVASTRASN
ncbi:MAG TPA: hypothetical protein VF624_13980 [Tepidisphaeraceae bacterium]|jgi:hypothetical protein